MYRSKYEYEDLAAIARREETGIAEVISLLEDRKNSGDEPEA